MSEYRTESIVRKSGWHYSMGGIVFSEDFTIPDLLKCTWPTLFAYMYRRFGAPIVLCDNHKRIAEWILTTPDPDVCLEVRIATGNIHNQFGYGIRIEAFQHPNDEEDRIIEALRATQRDLLKEVYVRDVAINALGEI